MNALTQKQVRQVVAAVQSAAVENCGSVDTERYQDSVRSAVENLSGRHFSDYAAPRPLSHTEAALVCKLALGEE